MKHSRKMVLIPEDEYKQLTESSPVIKSLTKSSPVTENLTKSIPVTENLTKSSQLIEKVTQIEPMVASFPIESKCDFQNCVKRKTVQKKITKTSPAKKNLTQSMSRGKKNHESLFNKEKINTIYVKTEKNVTK